MELEILVEKITKQVLERLKAENTEDAGNGGENNGAVKQILVIVPEFAVHIDRYLNYVAGANGDCKLITANRSLYKTGLLLNIENIDAKTDTGRQYIMDSFENYEAVYCISPGVKLLRSIEMMEDNGFEENLIISSVLHKKKTKLLLDYYIDELGVNRLAQKTKEMISGIAALGIEIESIYPENISLVAAKGVKELITEQDVERLKNEGNKTIYYGKDCIITPLALDRAKEVGVLVIFRD